MTPSLSAIGLFSFRLLKHLSLLLFISLPLQLVGAILILPVLLPILKYLGHSQFPACFRWFDSADQYCGRDTSTYDAIRDSGIWNWYCWVGWRNPLNYFGYKVLGYNVESISLITAYCDANFRLGEIGDTKHVGFIYSEFLINGSTLYEYYWVKAYNFRGTEKCIRFRMGYKLDVPVIGEWCQEVFVIQPFHAFTGVL